MLLLRKKMLNLFYNLLTRVWLILLTWSTSCLARLLELAYKLIPIAAYGKPFEMRVKTKETTKLISCFNFCLDSRGSYGLLYDLL